MTGLSDDLFGDELSSEAQQAYDAGINLIRQGKHEEGRAELRRFFCMCPRTHYTLESDAHLTKALSHWETEEYDAALEEIRVAKELFLPGTTDSMYKTVCTIEERIKNERNT